ncbi:LysR family transcriptional regulator [Vibrio methylphosphonaticus]|uniref:LysR family transcriptional regulator n=1 Tax=Vibrio methylphosphonaticus TaxID=2946866 RepID=UPI00202AB67C|nr:LysR family transcriptional regulator [Vibrio methylphosphonaticus]MCL9776216.1 LysR family transcriptional regulator [Vibrio methylphosphonaticus]
MQHKKIERLMLFSEVAKQLSFTKAADTLDISRGYLSTQIKQLEKELGYSLMIRSTRSIRLTPQGERIATGMESISQTLVDLERKAEYENQCLEGTIRITAPMQFTQGTLLDVCRRFTGEHPGIKFDIECSYQSFNLVRDNFDFAFRATRNPPDNMIAKKLFSYSHAVTGAPSYFARVSRPTHPDQLLEHDCLNNSNDATWPFSDGEYPIRGWLKNNDNHILKTQALEGRGIIYTPDYFVRKEINSGKLVSVLSEYISTSNDVYLLYPPIVNRSQRLSKFIEFVLSEFQSSAID